MINKEAYKRLTKKGGFTKKLDLTQELGYSQIYNRLAELEDKIENGTLVFIDAPFYSKSHDCWAVFQRYGDIVETCFMTESQAEEYKAKAKLKESQEYKK